MDSKKYKLSTNSDNFFYKSLNGGLNDNNIISDKFNNWITKYLNDDNIIKIYSLPIIWIDFQIAERTNTIRLENIYDKYVKCEYININDKISSKIYELKKLYYDINNNSFSMHFVSKILFKKFKKIFKITSTLKNADITIDDKLQFVYNKEKYNNQEEYNKQDYDLIRIATNISSTDKNSECNTHLYLKKNIIGLIWALKHLDKNGCIVLLIRETLTPAANDLLLLLQQFSSVTIYFQYIINRSFKLSLNIICTDFREVPLLIKHLETILTFNLDSKTLSFLTIKKVIRGNLDEFNKITLKPSKFILNRLLDYINCFKDNNNQYQEMPEEIQKLYLYKINLFLTKEFIPKPEHMPYISSLLHLKKIKIGDEFIDLHSNIKKEEGKVLYKLIKETNATQVLEIGMAYGLSSLFILQALKYYHNKHKNDDDDDVNYRLTSIDPFQMTQWKGLGRENLKKTHLIGHHKLIEQLSYIALPELVEKKKIYDLIFIDGWHTFDYTLIDLFNAYVLVKLNGYIIIDDALHPGVNKVTKYVETNYQFLKKIDMGVKTVAIYQKISEDKRNLSFHREF